MRLIDADALKSRIERMWKSRQLTNTKYKTFIELLDVEPTIEPERKKGRWVPYVDENGELYGDKCSECGAWYVMPDGKTSYCPECGAWMEGER